MLATAIEGQQLMSHLGFGPQNGVRPAGLAEPGDDYMKEKEDEMEHAGQASRTPKKPHDSGPIQSFALDRLRRPPVPLRAARRSATPGKKWLSFIVFSHSSEILTLSGEDLRGIALVTARFG
jgi:hypothetical protein